MLTIVLVAAAIVWTLADAAYSLRRRGRLGALSTGISAAVGLYGIYVFTMAAARLPIGTIVLGSVLGSGVGFLLHALSRRLSHQADR